MIFTDSSQKCLIKALFTLCQIAFVPAQKPYQLGLQFSHESAYFCNGAQLHYTNFLTAGSHIGWVFTPYWIYNDGHSWDTFGTLLHFWGVFQYSHRSNPSPHPTNNVGLVYPEFFLSFNFVQGEGRENCKKISKRMQCLGTLQHFWGVFQYSHRSNPSPHPTSNVGCKYPEFFPSFNFVQGGGRCNCKKIFEKNALFKEGTEK